MQENKRTVSSWHEAARRQESQPSSMPLSYKPKQRLESAHSKKAVLYSVCLGVASVAAEEENSVGSTETAVWHGLVQQRLWTASRPKVRVA